MKCPHCKKVFSSQKRYTDHIEKRICFLKDCLVCRKSFKTEYALKRHEESQDHKRRMGFKPKTDTDKYLDEYAELVNENKKNIKRMEEIAEIIEGKSNRKDTEGGQVINNIHNNYNNTNNIYNDHSTTVFNIIFPNDQLIRRGRTLKGFVEMKTEFEPIVLDMLEKIFSDLQLEIYWEGPEKNPVVVNQKRYDFTGILPEIKKVADAIVDKAIQRSKDEGSYGKLEVDLTDFMESIREVNNPSREIKHDPERPYMRNPETVKEVFKSGIPLPKGKDLEDLNAQIKDPTIYAAF